MIVVSMAATITVSTIGWWYTAALIPFRSSHVISATPTLIPESYLKSKMLSSQFSREGTSAKSHRFNIALIKPIFTAAAYRYSFYEFFLLNSRVPTGKNVTTDLSLLSSIVDNRITQSSSAFEMFFLYHHLKMSLPQSNIDILTDADVDGSSSRSISSSTTFSSIFESAITTNNNNNNKYDILIIGHQEYVTQREYDNLKQFVANGGTLIVLDGNVFYAEVKYDRNTNMLTLVKGHGWAFNGKSAWKSVSERWKKETSQWLGSNYLCYACHIRFLNNPFEYKHHEEQYMTNPNDMVIMNYNAAATSKNYHIPIAKPVVATYQLNYQKGKVIVLGLYSNDIISNSKFQKFFDWLLLHYALSPKIINNL
jgi:hypothetical protein